MRGSGSARSRRWLTVVVVVLVALGGLLSVPAGAVEESNGPSGATGKTTTSPGGSESADNPSSSSTSTTTTTKPKAAAAEPPATTTPTIPPEDRTPSAGPPELTKAGVFLPDDSLVAATEELTLERAKVELLSTRRVALDELIQDHEKKLVKLRAERKHLESERQARAVATYRGQSSGWRLGVIVDHSLNDERAVYLVAAADAASRLKIKDLERSGGKLVRELKDARQERTGVANQLGGAIERLNSLLDKLAASNGTITTIDGELVYVPTGPSPVALLADAADKQLVRVMASASPAETDGAWLAARHTLAFELARFKGGGELEKNPTAAAIERDWAATPLNVLHATFFALRQVGKAYVYATAGPDTFDCSGLTKAAYAQLHLGLPHFSGAQLHAGLPVLPDALRTGDLLTYGPDGSEHVTMYVGGGLVVEAKGRAYGVIVSPARTDPTKGFAGATRIVP